MSNLQTAFIPDQRARLLLFNDRFAPPSRTFKQTLPTPESGRPAPLHDDLPPYTEACAKARRKHTTARSNLGTGNMARWFTSSSFELLRRMAGRDILTLPQSNPCPRRLRPGSPDLTNLGAANGRWYLCHRPFCCGRSMGASFGSSYRPILTPRAHGCRMID